MELAILAESNNAHTVLVLTRAVLGFGCAFLSAIVVAIVLHLIKLIRRGRRDLVQPYIAFRAISYFALAMYATFDMADRLFLPGFTWRIPLVAFTIVSGIPALLFTLSYLADKKELSDDQDS